MAAEPSGPDGGRAERAEGFIRETIERCEAEFDELAEDPFSDGVLEALQELGSETGGFVETEAVGGVGGIRSILSKSPSTTAR